MLTASSRFTKESKMSLFSRLLGKHPDYPPLEESNPAARQLAAIREPLQKLASEVSDPLEVVPSEGTAYVFVGKPPKKFGLAWIHDGKVSNFKTLVEEKGIQPSALRSLLERLTTAYERSDGATRYMSNIGDRQFVVTPCEDLEKTVHEIMDRVEA